MSNANIINPPVPVMKGNASAFTCLGNWYDLADSRSMASLALTLLSVNDKRDSKTAFDEIVQAVTRWEEVS